MNALSLSSQACKILKYADDTVIIGLIKGNNEQEYRNAISYAINWCVENHLDLNVTTTKEMIFDNRKKKNHKEPVVINNTNVTVSSSYK